MKLWQKVVIRLLYLTPFGYFLSTFSLLQGETVKGLYVDLERFSPIKVHIKQKITPGERLGWLVNALFLLAQGWFVLSRQIAGDIGGAFALVAFIFGGVCLISAFFPNFPWNKKFLLI